MAQKWNIQQLDHTGEAAALDLAQDLHLHPVLGRLLWTQGIRNKQAAKRFFSPRLSDLHDPFLMEDMHEAVERINQAMAQKERIMIYGDYDVDGVSAVALVYRFLVQHYENIDYYIPDRNNDGHGVSQKGIDFAAQSGVRLIIVLDCGTKAIEEIDYAQSLGIDFIICDHHTPDNELPQAVALLNAKRSDNTYPYTELSGCGVGFKLMQAFAQRNGIAANKLYELLELCALSIASDLVHITGENRILTYHGLRQLNGKPSVGLQALIALCGLETNELTVDDIIYRIGPRINAAGRMLHGREAVRLLVEDDPEKAQLLAAQINQYNEARKELDRTMTEQAIAQVTKQEEFSTQKSIIIHSEKWHKGIIGIVASRVSEHYFRPTVVMAVMEKMVTASVRSVSGFNVYKAVQSCADLLDNFGGHALAVGLTMRREHVEEFSVRFESYVASHITQSQQEEQKDLCAALSFSELDFNFYKQLKRFAPFGVGNPRPIFCTRRVYDYGTSKVVGRGQQHIKLELVDKHHAVVMNGIAFGQSAQARYIKSRRAFDICYTIEENTHRRGEVQLQIVDILPCDQ